MSGQTSRIEVNGVGLNVVDTGRGAPTLLFLHYFGGSSRTWSRVIHRLSSTHRCVALDFRGWGRSDKTPTDYGLDTLAADVRAAIAALRLGDFVLIGHSMGGKVAQIVASHGPAGLKGLVLVAPAPPTSLPTSDAQRDFVVSSYSSREGVERVIEILAARPLGKEQREQVIEDTLASPLAAKRAWPEQGMALDISDRAGDVQVPIRIVVGSEDQVETEASLREAFGRFHPDAEFAILAGAGHLAPMEAPAEVAEAIRAAPFV